MKTRLLIIILMMMMMMAFSAIYASEDTNENEEHWRKTKELKALSERFKADTGFGGTIEYNYDSMQLGSFRGIFSDITISNDQDTLLVRQAFERIVDKILPYTYATKNQLTATAISNNNMFARTDFVQIINGYRIESGGLIGMSYNKDNRIFHIGNSAVDIPQVPIGRVISEEEAIEHVKNYYVENLNYPDTIKINPYNPRIAYAKGKDNVYHLCYILGVPDPNPEKFADYTVLVDVITGEIRSVWDLRQYAFDCTVAGKVYGTSSSTDFDYPYTELMPDVAVVNYDIPHYTDDTGTCSIPESSLSENFHSDLKYENTYFLTIYPSETLIREADLIETNNTLNSISINYYDDSSHSMNVYFHILSQHKGLKRHPPIFLFS